MPHLLQMGHSYVRVKNESFNILVLAVIGSFVKYP
jgi:hypothetical protein